MLTHAVFFRLKQYSPETARDLVDRLRALPERIPAIRELEAGVDVDRSDRAWDVALIVRCDSREDLEAYAAHPAHREVVDFILEVAERSAVVDFES